MDDIFFGARSTVNDNMPIPRPNVNPNTDRLHGDPDKRTSEMGDRVDHVLQLVHALCSVRATTHDLRELASRECARERNIVRAAVKTKDALEAKAGYYEDRMWRTQEMSTSDRLLEMSRGQRGEAQACDEGARQGARQDAVRLRRLAEGRPVAHTGRDGVMTTVWYRKVRPGAADGRARGRAAGAQKEALQRRHREIATKLHRMQMEATPRVPPMPVPRTVGDDDYELYLTAFQRHMDTARANKRRRVDMTKLEEERVAIERRLRTRETVSEADAWEEEKKVAGDEGYARMARKRKMSHVEKMTAK
jgi:hypothetical protein